MCNAGDDATRSLFSGDGQSWSVIISKRPSAFIICAIFSGVFSFVNGTTDRRGYFFHSINYNTQSAFVNKIECLIN